MNKQEDVTPVHLTMFTSIVVFVAWLACATLFGQSAAPVDRPQTIHIHGTIRNFAGAAVSNVDVVFKRDTFTKTVFTDEGGSYDVDLPAGLYTMTASPL